MKRSISIMLTGVLAAAGLALLALAVMSGSLSADDRRFIAVATLLACTCAVAVAGAIAARSAEDDYRGTVKTAAILLTSGLLCLTTFFGVIGSIVSRSAWGILLVVMLTCYGITLLMVAGANTVFSQKDYRTFYFDFARQLPSLYYRYRT